jgi:hypothetical protein
MHSQHFAFGLYCVANMSLTPIWLQPFVQIVSNTSNGLKIMETVDKLDAMNMCLPSSLGYVMCVILMFNLDTQIHIVAITYTLIANGYTGRFDHRIPRDQS